MEEEKYILVIFNESCKPHSYKVLKHLEISGLEEAREYIRFGFLENKEILRDSLEEDNYALFKNKKGGDLYRIEIFLEEDWED